ncbi:nucleolar pre-ribosomal-associated protein 1 [Lycorma delicatula]|uniref:nucleolar pre-ribosomal-associated protein 1 n=1 Tax=Lycorma delicatula TaxID=130591 RepID=UPI003F510470
MDEEPANKKKRLSKMKNDSEDTEIRNSEKIVDNGNSKNVKTSNFEPHSLRKKLRENTALQAVKLLLAANDDPGCDAVKSYINAGGGPLELLQVINNSDMKKNLTCASPVFSAVQLVIMKILSDFPLLHKSAEEACCYLLHEYMPTIHLMIAPSASVNHKIVALKLLTSVVSLSTQLARDVLNSINLEYSNVEHLAAQVSPYDSKNVRITFIHFILSFMVDGNSYLIRQLLQNKGLLRLVTQDLIFDNSTTIIFLLTTLYEKVVSTTMIPKSLKLHCFNTAVLITLFELYNWLGPKHWVSKKSLTEDRFTILFKGDEEERNRVRKCVHSLLILLLTSHKLGIVFNDRNMGTGPCQNVIIRSLFKAIEKQWEDKLMKDLTKSILLANPDVITPAFVSFKKLFEPRSTTNWILTVDFLIQVVEKLDPKLCLPDTLATHQLLKLTKNFCFPTSVLQTVCSEESFNNKDPAVRAGAIKYLVTTIKKMEFFISSAKFSSKTVVPVIIKHLNKFGPKLEWIVSAWKMGTKTSEEITPLSLLSKLDYNILFVEFILLFYKLSPEYFDSAQIWSDDLIKSSLVDCSKITDETNQEKIALFKLETLKMVSVLKKLSPTEEAFGVSIQMLTKLMETHLKAEGKVVLERLLLSTGFMEGVEDEVEIWQHCLTKEGVNDSVITFFQDIIQEASCNIAVHFKTITDASNEAVAYHGHAKSNIDDLIIMVEEELEDNKVHRCNIIPTQQSISPLIPAMLKIISNKNWLKKDVHSEEKQNFVTAVLIHCLHRQMYPERLHKVIKKVLIGSAFAPCSYIASWNEPGVSPHPLTFVPFHSNSIESKLSKFFLQQGKSTKLANEILGILNSCDGYSPKLLLHLCVFYLTQLYQRSNLTVEIVQNVVEIISKLLNCMDHSSQAFISMLQGVLMHPLITDMFQPLKKDLFIVLTKVVILFANAANQFIKDNNILNNVLMPCKNKLMRALLKKIKREKGLKIYNLSLILKEFSLSEEDIQTVFSHLINLPISIQEDGWFDVETLLLSQSASNNILLSETIFSTIIHQMVQLNGGPNPLQQAFMLYIKRYPHYIEYVKSDLFLVLLKERGGEISLELAKLLLSCDKRLLSVFKDNLVETPSLLFPLLSVTDCAFFGEDVMKNVLSKQITNIEDAILNQASWYIQHSDFIVSCLEKYMDKKSKKKLYGSLKTQWNYVPCQLNVLKILKLIIIVDASQVIDIMVDIIGWVIQILDGTSKEGYDWLYNGVAEILHSVGRSVDWTQLLLNGSCYNVMRQSLKYGLRQDNPSNVSIMKMLVAFCSMVFFDNQKDDISEYFSLVISHSDFISIMLDNSDVKYQTVQLLLVLLKMNPNLASSSHVPIYLSAYGATLNKTDQILLELLQLYENNGASVWEWRPCLWGPTAANYYSVHSKSSQPLWRQPRMSQVLDLLNKDVVDLTISKFPLKRSLKASDFIDVEDGEKIYDPAFLLPLFSHLLAPGADVQHRSMVNSGALAIVLSALSNINIEVRTVAYLVLTRFHSHLSSGDNDQQLWLNFINVIRGGVLELQEEYPQIATVVTTFLAQTSLALSLPQHPLFSALHNFILAKTALSLNSVPALLELLQSNDVHHREHQKWILEVLRDGTRQKVDMNLLFQNLVFKILMTFYSFVHTPKDLKVLIIDVISSCIGIQDVGYVLVSNYGLISWISHSLICKDFDETHSSLVNLLEKTTNFKNCSLHVKLILISLVINVTSVNDLTNILQILNNNKIISHINENDIKILINVTANLLGSDVVQNASDMIKFGCQYVIETKDSNQTVTVLNILVYNWLSKH